MRSTTVRRLRRLVPTLLVALSASCATASACPGAHAGPAGRSASAVRATTLCLLNVERSAQRLRPLRLSARLARAARRHSRDMVAHRYFAHDSLSGAGFSTRIARTGWMHGRATWFVGENLAWGGGSVSTPEAIVASWMASPPHRRNILQRRFRVVGIAAVSGLPVAGGGRGATYTTDFGS